MRVLIVGAGAVGGYFGAKLALAGHEVVFLARGAHGAAIRERGIKIESVEGLLEARGRVIEHIDEARDLGADVALVTVKAKDLQEVAAGTGEALSGSGFAIPLLNGLDSEAELAKMIGKHRVIGGVAQMAGGHLGPGRLYNRGTGIMVIAPLVPAQKPDVERLAQEFARCFTCMVEDDLNQVLWQKLLWNAPFNAICALTRKTSGEVLGIPSLEKLVRRAMAEVASVARAEGARLDEQIIERMLQATLAIYPDTEPSMLQDVLAGRPNECRVIQGAVVERAERHGIPSPIHSTLLALLEGLEHATK